MDLDLKEASFVGFVGANRIKLVGIEASAAQIIVGAISIKAFGNLHPGLPLEVLQIHCSVEAFLDSKAD